MKNPLKDQRPFVVRVSSSAFLDIATAAIEAALVPPEFNSQSLKILTKWDKERQNRSLRTGPLPGCLIFSDTGLEYAGCLLGTRSDEEARIVYRVERAYQVTTIRGDDWVSQCDLSPLVVDELAKAADTGWQVVGDIHSHPYIDARAPDIERYRYFAPSKMDFKGLPFPGYEISLVATVCLTGRKKAHSPDPNSPLCHARIGNFDVWLYAYTKLRPQTSQRLQLELASITKQADANPLQSA